MGIPEPLDSIPSPMVSSRPVKILLLGGGELGKEVAIEAQRLGFEVVVVDRYDWAPAMHVAHRRYVVNLLDCNGVKTIVRRENPTAVIPEIEAVCIDALQELEEEGYNIIPNARAVAIAMNRIELRRFAAEKLGLPTTRYAFASNEDEAYEACEKVGYPCLMKPEMSSSGHGHVRVEEPSRERVVEAYRYAVAHARGASRRVIVEEYVSLETEFTVLAYRYVTPEGNVVTDALPPVEHQRYGEYHYIDSWQPSSRPRGLLDKAVEIGVKIAEALGGVGIFGVELLYTRDGRLLFSEVAPRPHDTGLVTLKSMELSEFAIHARASVGLPVPKPRLVTPAASRAIYTSLDNVWAPRVTGVGKALAIQGVDIRVFGKPVTYPGRRMAVLLATGATPEEALEKVKKASELIRVEP